MKPVPHGCSPPFVSTCDAALNTLVRVPLYQRPNPEVSQFVDFRNQLKTLRGRYQAICFFFTDEDIKKKKKITIYHHLCSIKQNHFNTEILERQDIFQRQKTRHALLCRRLAFLSYSRPAVSSSQAGFQHHLSREAGTQDCTRALTQHPQGHRSVRRASTRCPILP